MLCENYKINNLIEDFKKDEGEYSFLEFVKLCAESDESFYSWVLGEETEGWNLTEEQEEKWQIFLDECEIYNESAKQEIN